MSRQIFRFGLWQLTLIVTASVFWATSAGAFQAATPAPIRPILATLEVEFEKRKETSLEFSQSMAVLKKEIAALDHHLDGLDISPASIDEVLKVLQTQRVNLMIELAGLNARQKAATALSTGEYSL